MLSSEMQFHLIIVSVLLKTCEKDHGDSSSRLRASVDRGLSSGSHYPLFEQPKPDVVTSGVWQRFSMS